MSRTMTLVAAALLCITAAAATELSPLSAPSRTVPSLRQHPLLSSPSSSPAFIALRDSIHASSRSHTSNPKGKADAGGKCAPAKPPVPCPGYDAEVGTDLVCMQLGCCYTEEGCFSRADAKPFGRPDSKPPGELDSTPQLPPGAKQAPAKKRPKSHDEYKEEMEMKILAQQQRILANQAKIIQDIEHRQAKERAEKFDKMHSDAAAAGGLADPHKPVETEDEEPEKEPGKTYISWDKYKNPNDKPSPYWTATNAGAWHPQIPDYHRIATYTAPRYQPYYIAGGQYEYKAGPFFYREGQRLKYPNAVFNNHQPVAAPDLHIHKFDEPDPYDNPNPFPGVTQLPDILPSDRGGASSEETFGLKTSNDKLPIAPGIRVDPHYHQIQQLISNPAGPYKEGAFLELETSTSARQIDRLTMDPNKPNNFNYALSPAKRDRSGQVISPATVTMTPSGTPNGEKQVLTIPPVAGDIEQASALASQFNQRANGNAESNSNSDSHGFPYVLNNAHDVQSTPYYLREPAGKVIEPPEGMEDFAWQKIEDRTEGSNAEKRLAMEGKTAPPINYLRNSDPIQTPRGAYPANDPNSDHQIYPQMFPDAWDPNHESGDPEKEAMIRKMIVGAMNMKPPAYYNPNPSWYNPMPNPNYPHTFPIQTAKYPSPAEGDGGGGEEGDE